MKPHYSSGSWAAWEDEQIRSQRIQDRALELCAQAKREITGSDVAETLYRLGEDLDDVCKAIAECIKQGKLVGIGSLLEAQIENDLFETAKRDAEREEQE